MPVGEPLSESTGSAAVGFGPTRWSVVLAAGRSQSTHARDALEQLCRAYWYPLYAFVRRQGYGPDDAQDLTQEFFARLIEKHYLQSVDQAKGKFRSFLLAALKHFLANEYYKATAQKRGGRASIVSLNAASAETTYAAEPADDASPDKLYERRWAMTLLHRVLAQLRAEYVEAGRAALFEQLKPALTGERNSRGYAEIAQSLGMSEAAIKVGVHRLRQRFRQLLRQEIGHTVSTQAEVEEELRALFAAFAG